MSWVLVVMWAVASGGSTDSSANPRSAPAIASQEFNDVMACQFASVEIQKMNRDLRVLCVPKGSK